jgi:deoxyhypusine synthase
MAKKSGNTKRDYLKSKVEHIDITKIDAVDIVKSMKKMSFSARDLASAAEMYNRMLADRNCVIFLTLAGSTSAAGCMQIYADLVKYNMVDAVVATGASIVDMDFFEALGFSHYQGTPHVDDSELRRL